MFDQVQDLITVLCFSVLLYCNQCPHFVQYVPKTIGDNPLTK